MSDDDRRDARNTLRNLPHLWGWLAEGRDVPERYHERREEQRRLLAAFVGRDGDLPSLASAAHARAGDPDVDLDGVLDGSVRLLGEAASALRAAGVLPRRTTGTVVQLNVSDGGVPKRPVPRADVGPRGLAGDRQAARQHHGRPWQAVCLWSAEVIDELATAGHPLSYGAAGENVTVRGLPWAEVRPGVRIAVGEALAEVTAYALPCSKNARWFLGGDVDVMSHERGPVSRVYARVLRPGSVAAGDPAVLEP